MVVRATCPFCRDCGPSLKDPQLFVDPQLTKDSQPYLIDYSVVFLSVHTIQIFFSFHSIAVLFGNMKLGMVRIEKGGSR